MAIQFEDSSLPIGGHVGLEYYNINYKNLIKIYQLRDLNLHSKIKQLILKHGTEILVSISSQDFHNHQINI